MHGTLYAAQALLRTLAGSPMAVRRIAPPAWASKALRFVVPFAPGGGPEIVAGVRAVES
jgi:tripartite-type tricarboxylate transporter receptor subunit TctC